MSVLRCQDEVSAGEFLEWMNVYQRDPWGEERADYRAGIVAATLANIHRSKGRRFKPDDFMPKFQSANRRQTQHEMVSVFKSFVEAQAAKQK